LTTEHQVLQVRNHAVERLVVRRNDGDAGAINVNHRPCRGKQGATMPHGDNDTSSTASH